MKNWHKDTPATKHGGWTLVELLVAMALGLLIIAGVGQIYLAAKRSYDIQTSIARLQDVGRYATDILTQDIRNAGNWGILMMNNAAANGLLTGNVPPDGTCQTGNTNWGSMVERRLFGLNDTSGNYTCISRDQGDVLVVRYADPTTATPYTGTGLYITASPISGIITTSPSSTPPPPPAPGNELKLDYALIAHAYYVRKTAVTTTCGGAQVNVPDMAREELDNSGQPITKGLVTGVEWLEFQYGVSTSGGTTVTYMNADSVGNWGDVKTVRFWVLVRDDCPEGDYKDNNTYVMGDKNFKPPVADVHFRRALYTSTVALRNQY